MSWLRFSYRFILLPSFAGFACYGCSANDIFISGKAPNAPTRQEQARQSQPPNAKAQTNSETTSTLNLESAVSVPEAKPEPVADQPTSSIAYQDGINLASSAHILSQTALSPDDWGLVASRWQRAADQLATLEPTDTNYTAAQPKIAEYRRNAEAANAQIAQLQTTEYVPLPKVSTPEINRRTVVAAPVPATPAPPVANSQAVSNGSEQRVRIPIVRRLHGTPVVRVTFNRVRTYDMILDTGASRTLITRQMANELGVVITDQMLAATASQAEVRFDIGRMDVISMGNVTLTNAQVSIGDAVDVGLLGNDFLRDYDVIIRSKEGVVELVKSSYR